MTGKLLKAWATSGGELGAYSPDFHQKADQGSPKENEQLFVHILDTQSNKPLETVTSSFNWTLFSMKFSPNEKCLVGLEYGPKGGTVVAMWNLQTTTQLLADLNGEIEEFYFSPDSSLVAAFTGTEGGIELWSTKDGHREAGLPSKQVDLVAFAPDNHVLAAIGAEHQFVIYETKTGNPIKSFYGYKEEALSLLFTADGSKFIAAYADGAIRIYGWRKGRLLLTLQMFPSPSNDWIAYTPEGQYDGSPGVERLIRWKIRDRLFRGSRYAKRFHHAEAVRDALRFYAGWS